MKDEVQEQKKAEQKSEQKKAAESNKALEQKKPEQKKPPKQKSDLTTLLLRKNTQKLLALSEVSLWLDSYEDIFSDFDPRPFSQRGLSDDFLYEAKKASRDRPSGVSQLLFLIPVQQRNKAQEPIIKMRLRKHFSKHYNRLKKETKNLVREGLAFIGIGVFLMLISSFILFKYSNVNFIISFFIVLLEPAGWFLFWEGLHLVIFESRKAKPDFEFYKKMAKCDISFLSY